MIIDFIEKFDSSELSFLSGRLSLTDFAAITLVLKNIYFYLNNLVY